MRENIKGLKIRLFAPFEKENLWNSVTWRITLIVFLFLANGPRVLRVTRRGIPVFPSSPPKYRWILDKAVSAVPRTAAPPPTKIMRHRFHAWRGCNLRNATYQGRMTGVRAFQRALEWHASRPIFEEKNRTVSKKVSRWTLRVSLSSRLDKRAAGFYVSRLVKFMWWDGSYDKLMYLFFFFRFWVASLDCLYERIFFKLLKILHPVTYHDLYELVWVSSEREKFQSFSTVRVNYLSSVWKIIQKWRGFG